MIIFQVVMISCPFEAFNLVVEIRQEKSSSNVAKLTTVFLISPNKSLKK